MFGVRSGGREISTKKNLTFFLKPMRKRLHLEEEKGSTALALYFQKH
jgi:hypothetical protein